MRKSFLSAEAWPARGVGLFLALTLAACAALPGGTAGKTTPKTKTRVAASASKAPSPTPSLGLLLSGKVTVDPSSMLANKVATATSNGVKLISDNGLGLISDNGLGLISDNGLGLISDNGLGLISDNGLGLISDNGLGYRIMAAGSAPAGGSGALKPVEGMVVTAVNLFTGKVIAGPVATKADGSYQLGFLKAPDKNIGIVAGVNVKNTQAKYTYATLTAPEAKPVVTSDTTRALTRYLLGVLPGRIQPWVEMVKAGTPPQVDPSDTLYEVELKQLLQTIPPERCKEADKMPDGRPGQLALTMSQRILANLDFNNQEYLDFYAITEEARAFGESVQPPPNPSLVDQVMKLAQDKVTARQLPDLLKKYGMEPARADQLAADMKTKAEAVGAQIVLLTLAHKDDVFQPIKDLAKPAP